MGLTGSQRAWSDRTLLGVFVTFQLKLLGWKCCSSTSAHVLYGMWQQRGADTSSLVFSFVCDVKEGSSSPGVRMTMASLDWDSGPPPTRNRSWCRRSKAFLWPRLQLEPLTAWPSLCPEVCTLGERTPLDSLALETQKVRSTRCPGGVPVQHQWKPPSRHHQHMKPLSPEPLSSVTVL